MNSIHYLNFYIAGHLVCVHRGRIWAFFPKKELLQNNAQFPNFATYPGSFINKYKKNPNFKKKALFPKYLDKAMHC